MNKARVHLLQSMAPFGGLGEEALDVLIGDAEAIVFHPSETVIREHAEAGSVLVIEEGRARVEKNYQGRAFPLCWVKRGDCIGEISLLDPGPRSSSVVAETRVDALRLGFSDFNRLRRYDLAQFTLLQLNIAREVCRRMRKMEVLLMDAVHGRADLELSLEQIGSQA